MKEERIREPDLVSRIRLPRWISTALGGAHWAFLQAVKGKLPLRVIFVLSHQRSGSSLLVHCLNTNRKVLGFGETLIHYAAERDLRRLPIMIMARTRKLVASQRYVVDKLLYDELIQDPRLLRSENVKIVFLLREPTGALQSLIRAPKLEGWAQRPEANREYVDQENVTRYYCQRLKTLEQYARTIGDKSRSLFITHEQLLNRTGEVFGALQQLLEIDGSFSESYEVLRTTGVPGHGDVSSNIKKGFVDHNIRHAQVAVRQDLVGKANVSFDCCSRTLLEYCSHIASET